MIDDRHTAFTENWLHVSRAAVPLRLATRDLLKEGEDGEGDEDEEDDGGEERQGEGRYEVVAERVVVIADLAPAHMGVTL